MGGDVFVGSYSCSQGRTGLRLTIDRWPAARFTFFPVEGSKNSCSGEFAMAGSWNPRRQVLTFSPAFNPWITNPCGYVSLGLTGDLSEKGHEFAGHIIQSSDDACSTFSVDMVHS